MKGSKKVLTVLDALLADELTAINQYVVHAEMCANWGYKRLHGLLERRARVEMKHAGQLISRMLLLEGSPTVSKLNAVHIGETVEEQLRLDHDAELTADAAYNEGIKVAVACGDNGTRELLEAILADEEGHIDEIEAQLAQIEQMGCENFLSLQVAAP